MASIDIYKSKMPKGLRTFFENYEDSVKELINYLDSDGLLLKNFSEEQVMRLINLIKSCNMTLKLSNDFYQVFDLDEVKRKEKIGNLQRAFGTNNESRIAEHFMSILTNTYITLLEKFKIYLLFFIDWNKLNKKHKEFSGLGGILRVLNPKYINNKYLTYFNTGTRNSFAHYTFFFGVGSKINLCSEILDKNPREMSLFELIKEIQELTVLTEGFYILLRDKYNLPEIKSEMLER